MKKRLLSLVLAATSAILCCACSSDKQDDSSKELTPEQIAFNTYHSNTYIATGNNYMIEEANSVTYRAYFPLEKYGESNYAFYFSNNVDSTYDNGGVAHIGQKTGSYTIESAFVADGGTGEEDEITNRTQVTFDGKKTKEVKSGETFWSDSVKMNYKKGHYLVWEWTVTGKDIPCTRMSALTSATCAQKAEETFSFTEQLPLPQIIGTDSEFKGTVAAIGDSITQGCQTDFMAYEFWAARIAQSLADDYSFYNGGLGWSRASDAVESENWVDRVKQAETVIVAFGTNDVAAGKYGDKKGATAEQFMGYIKDITKKLTEADCHVIVFTLPPENFKDDLEQTRLDINKQIKAEYADCDDVDVFDFASYLCDSKIPAVAKYGAHPNGEGGEIVAKAFLKEFKDLFQA